MSVVFVMPGQRLELPPGDVRRLLGELQMLGEEIERGPERPPSRRRYDARGALQRLERSLAGGDGARPPNLEQWTHGERQALARALEHLRNATPRLPPPLVAPVVEPLHVLRNAVVGLYQFGTIPYELELISSEHDAGEPCFASYSGEYAAGDRLVADNGEAFRVVAREAGSAERERLIVEPFELRKTERSLR